MGPINKHDLRVIQYNKSIPETDVATHHRFEGIPVRQWTAIQGDRIKGS